MNLYSIGEEGIKKFRKRFFKIFLPTVAIAATIYLTFNFLYYRSDLTMAWIFMAAMVVYFSFNTVRTFRKQKKILQSYRLTVTDNEIIREQANMPPLTINFMEVKEIIKTKRGAFIVKGATRNDCIQVPSWIDDATGLEEQLQRFATISTSNSWLHRLYGALAIRLTAIAMLITTVAAENKVIVGVCGAALIGVIIWAINEVRVNKNIGVNMKRRSYVIYTLIVLVVLFNLYAKVWLFWG